MQISFSFQSLFTTNLSQRIRHMRWLGKKMTKPATTRASLSVEASASTPKRRCSRENLSLPDEEYKTHMEQLKKEWAKPAVSRSETHVKNLLKETFNNRQSYIKSLPDSSISPAVNATPCLEDGTYVS